ncbi:hypothetical protein [Marilutibacter alkalisoli]|uniref:Uncharacterized protein n=1 Tax=Marilutibacter alkalisoli TaxID=2591633 RepID=A0A514BUW6_9GAMM|nr:hypothetical protein [Lysobacter alkalisoli]QDH71152.1 hypothetical protein FKV23_14450 [Lysobacter alkalisoli]
MPIREMNAGFASPTTMAADCVSRMHIGTSGRRPFVRFAVGSVILLWLHFASEHNHSWLAFVAWFRSLPIT